MTREAVEGCQRPARDRVPASIGQQLQRPHLVDLTLVPAGQNVQDRGKLGPLDRLDEPVMGADHRLERDGLTVRGVGPRLPRELLGAARVRAREIEEMGECLLLGRLSGRLELEVQILEKVGSLDARQLHPGGLAEDRLVGVLEHHLQRIADRSGEQQRDVVGTRAHQRRADDRQRVARAVPESLELVEDDHEVLRQRAQRGQLGVQRLGVLFGLHARAPHGSLDHLDVEADLLLQETDLTLSGAPQLLDRVAHHRVVDAPDEPRDADDALEVDLDDVERRRVRAVRLGQLQGELVHERRLARVAGPEQRDVGLRLQRHRDLVGERLHPDDLRRVVQRPVPDERIERHRRIVPPRAYRFVPDMRYRPRRV